MAKLTITSKCHACGTKLARPSFRVESDSVQDRLFESKVAAERYLAKAKAAERAEDAALAEYDRAHRELVRRVAKAHGLTASDLDWLIS